MRSLHTQNPPVLAPADFSSRRKFGPVTVSLALIGFEELLTYSMIELAAVFCAAAASPR